MGAMKLEDYLDLKIDQALSGTHDKTVTIFNEVIVECSRTIWFRMNQYYMSQQSTKVNLILNHWLPDNVFVIWGYKGTSCMIDLDGPNDGLGNWVDFTL